jgi:single-strand DNA-binding protein
MASVQKTATIVGVVGNIYDLRTVGKDNKSVIDFSVAVTPRKMVDGEWTDAETIWTNVTAWARLADNIAESWQKGDRVFVHGRCDMKAGYTNRDGVEVAAKEIIIAEFAGHENSYRPSTQERTDKGNSGASKPAAQPAAQRAPAQVESPAVDLDFELEDLDTGDLPF